MTLPLFEESLTVRQRECVESLREIPNWPVNEAMDAELVRSLTKLYPSVEIEREAVSYRIWLLEHKSKKRVNHRRRFANWVKKSWEWGNERRSRSYRTHRAAEIEGHGDTVVARNEW